MSESSNAFKSAVHIIEELNPSIHVLSRAEHKMQDPDVEVDDIVNLLRNDPSITADILHLSNSAYYGPSEPCHDIKAAVSKIGFSECRNLINLCIAKNLMAGSLKHYRMDEGDALKESVTIALLMESLSSALNVESDNAYTIGLLSTLGKVVINKALEFKNSDSIYDPDEIMLVWEHEAIGFDHSQAGAMMLEGWEFPDSTVNVVAFQFRPDSANQDLELTYALNISRKITDKLGAGFANSEKLNVKLFTVLIEKFECSMESIDAAINAAREKYQIFSRDLGIT